MIYKDLDFQVKDGIAVITLDRPGSRNAFSVEMLESWLHAIKRCHSDPGIHVLILTGRGKCFCAGGDTKNFVRPDLSAWEMKSFLQAKVHPVTLAMEALDKPIIAAINGPAYGAGMDMALVCDMRIASKRAEFCGSYIRLGLAPGDGGAYLLTRLVGIPKAMEWLLTGDVIDANEALQYGLVNKVVQHHDLMDEAFALAGKIAARSPTAIRLTKKAIYQSLTSTLASHLDYISSQMGLLCETKEYKETVQKIHNSASQAIKAKNRD